uniref:Uncharacterized protein n=1 Tax=Magallana gigas TaxID=29159 RepID=A0A8W8L2Q6_MAGGI
MSTAAVSQVFPSLYTGPLSCLMTTDSGEDWDEQYRVTLGDLDTPIDEAPPKLPMETPRIRDSGETAMLSWFPARIPAYAKKTPITYIIEIKEPHVPGWSRLTSGIQ